MVNFVLEIFFRRTETVKKIRLEYDYIHLAILISVLIKRLAPALLVPVPSFDKFLSLIIVGILQDGKGNGI